MREAVEGQGASYTGAWNADGSQRSGEHFGITWGNWRYAQPMSKWASPQDTPESRFSTLISEPLRALKN